MRGVIKVVVRLIRAVQRICTRKWQFLSLFVILFIGSVFVLASLDLLPSTKSNLVLGKPDTSQATASASIQTPVIVELPTKIEIAKINLSTVISNPTTTDITLLDKELLKGAVRYPTTARLNEIGNVVLFGHSSYLPVVANPAYKAFNDIQKLKAGDVVTVYSLDTAYTYRVKSVEKENATSDQGIPLHVSGRVLTLVTCNSFATKEDRFVVTAEFVDSYSIST